MDAPILHQKMKILLSFTRPHVVANLYEFLSSTEHKGRHFEEWLIKQLFGTHWTEKKIYIMEVNGANVQIVLQNIFLSVEQKKETHTGLQQLGGE